MIRSQQVTEEAVRAGMMSDARWSVIRRDHPAGPELEKRARRLALHRLADEDRPLAPGDPLLALQWATIMLEEAARLSEGAAR